MSDPTICASEAVDEPDRSVWCGRRGSESQLQPIDAALLQQTQPQAVAAAATAYILWLWSTPGRCAGNGGHGCCVLRLLAIR